VATIVILSDIHANLVALDVVLAEIERLRPDEVVCLGDVAATGPRPGEVISRLQPLGWSYVRGNCDDALLRFAAGDADAPEDEHAEIDQWCAARLSPEALAFLASFQPVVTVQTPHGALCCYHGSPHANTDEILPETGDHELGRWLHGQHHARLYAGGHTHVQMLRSYRGAYLINPGSVGLPFAIGQDDQPVRPLWAEFAVVRVDETGFGVELRRVTVERIALIASARESGMPCLEWWAGDLIVES
jgi:putative phosphoesterase